MNPLNAPCSVCGESGLPVWRTYSGTMGNPQTCKSCRTEFTLGGALYFGYMALETLTLLGSIAASIYFQNLWVFLGSIALTFVARRSLMTAFVKVV